MVKSVIIRESKRDGNDKKTYFMSKLYNRKHEDYAQEVARGTDKVTAYKMVYPKASNVTAVDRSKKLIRQVPEVRQRIGELLEQRGIGVDDLNKKLKQLTQATKKFVFRNQVVDIPDSKIQLQAVELGYKLHKLINVPDMSTKTSIDARSVSFNISPADTERLEKITQNLDKLNESLKIKDVVPTGEVE